MESDNARTVAEGAALIRPTDSVATGLATGQPQGLLDRLGERADLVDVKLYTGLFVRPYSFLSNPHVHVVSGFFGPIERMARRSGGASIEYLPADFIGLEQSALRIAPRVVLAATTTADADGYLSFGVHAGATYRAFLEAARDPERVAIAETNQRMPWLDGIADLGGNRVHVSEIDAVVRHDAELFALPAAEPSDAEQAIAYNTEELIEDGATLQFGIGAVPNEIARLLARSGKGGFSIHSEMISDGVMALHQSGSVANRKEVHPGVTVATFVLGSTKLYQWLDHNSDVRIVPVSAVNDIAVIRRLRRFTSVNAALAIDLRGQVVADHVDGQQYSGIGGHETFVMAGTECPDGRSLLCLESTALIDGQRVSKIIPRVPENATVTTPRQHVQYVITEYGAVDLSELGDLSRADALIGIAHPDFRDWLREQSALTS